MLEGRPDDLISRLGYRIDYGEAARLAEIATFDHGWRRDLAARIGSMADELVGSSLRGLSIPTRTIVKI